MKTNTLNLVKNTLFALLLIIIINSKSNSQTLLVENFNFSETDTLKNLGNWIPSNTGTNNIRVKSPGLIYPGYMSSGIGNTALLPNPAVGNNTKKSFTEQLSGTVYYSFMIRVDSMANTSTESFITSLDAAGPSTHLSAYVYLKRISSSTFNIGLRKSFSDAVSYSPTVYSKNTTYLIVCSYTYVAGSDNDVCKIYINTSGVPATEPAVPSIEISGGSNDAPSIGEILLNNSFFVGLQGSPVRIDGIRIGTTWNNTLFGSLNVQLDLKALIQGFYSSVTDKMIKDTVTVILRYNLSPFSIADSSRVVLDSNGNGSFLFNKVTSDVLYFISVKHRNTLESWSRLPQFFIDDLRSYIFTGSVNSTYGMNAILIGTKTCFYSGDVNQDKSVNLTDVLLVNNNASTFTAGYKVTDVNGDNITDLSDMILTNNNASSFRVTITP